MERTMQAAQRSKSALRRWTGVAAATALVGAGGFMLVRSDGVRPTTVNSTSATRWLVHRPTGRLVLADGLTGRVTARIEARANETGEVASEGAGGAFLVATELGEARSVNTSLLQLSTAQTVALLAAGDTAFGVGPNGLTAVSAQLGEARLITATESLSIDVPTADVAKVATDGTIWLVRDGAVDHVLTDGARTTSAPAIDADDLVTIGSSGVLVDAGANELQWIGHSPVDFGLDSADAIVQESGPASPCLWVAAGDSMRCIGPKGLVQRSEIDGLDASPGDRLAVGGRAAAIIRANNGGVQRIDLATGTLITSGQADTRANADLEVNVTNDIIWVDDVGGDLAWAVQPFGINVIEKDDDRAPLLDDQGQVTEDAVNPGGEPNAGGGDGDVVERPVADDNGRDDPPVAVDDAVSARQDAVITVPVTSNDYDPDGEGIVLSSVENGDRGVVEIISATSVIYRPLAGSVGRDTFTYTIVDTSGDEATATVVVEMIDAGSPNRAPVSVADVASTGVERPVVVEVLLNDVDPERDPLDISSTESPDHGEVSLAVGPAGLPALQYRPDPGYIGTDTFRYVAVDPLGGLSEPTLVTIEVGTADGVNQPPVARPDAVRLRREQPEDVPVLLNDVDPDNDVLLLTLPQRPPQGLSVTVKGDQLTISASAGAPQRSEIVYQIDDGQGNVAVGRVLVAVVEDAADNTAPVANPDISRVVLGESVLVDVLANDTDPDGDPITVTSARGPTDGAATVTVEAGAVRVRPSATSLDQATTVVATYSIADGRGNNDESTVTVTVLPEPLPDPPFAQDDSATTERNQPVSINVLDNDGDPSGGRPTLAGQPGCPAGGTAVVTADNRVNFTPPTDRIGLFRCRYEVVNARGQRAGASIIIDVVAPSVVNRPPVTSTDSVTATAGGPPITVNLRSRVTDPDAGDVVTIAVTTLPPGATSSGDIVTYAAPANASGTVTIEYRASDQRGASTVGRISVLIQSAENQPPTANDLLRVVATGNPISVDVLAAASDPDDAQSTLTLQSVRQVSGNGSASQNGQLVTVDPPDTPGDVVVSFTVADPDGATASATLTVRVEIPQNRPPTAVDEQLQISSGGSGSINVLLNDSDPDGDPLTVTLNSSVDPSIGVLTTNASGAVSFNAAVRATGSQLSIDYTISDGELTDRGVLNLVILPCTASAPVATSATVFTPYQTPIDIDLNQFAANGLVVDVSGAGLTGPTGTYTPPAGENGNVSINFSVVNSCRLRDSGRVTIDVNRDPLASPVSRTIGRGEPVAIAVSELASDNEPLTITSLSGEPSWISFNGAQISGTLPDQPNQPSVTFDANVTDPGGLNVVVPVTISVRPNQPPVAIDDLVIDEDGSIQFNPTLNDSDPEGAILDLNHANFVTGSGSIFINNNDMQIEAEHGISVIEYEIFDDAGANDFAQIQLIVNRAPQAFQTGPVTGTGEVGLEADDPDDDPLVITLSGIPAGVSVAIIDDLTLFIDVGSYVGTGSFTYKVTDPFGAFSSSTVQLNVVPSGG
jgi:hypothetical protein